MDILVTGAAGFIGFHTCRGLLENGRRVVGVDSLDDYYSPVLKRARLAELACYERFRFSQLDLSEDGALETAVSPENVSHVIHLAAQAGVRYSLENPRTYVRSNLNGQINVLEFARQAENLEHFIYASSSSVYGERGEGPFAENDMVGDPESLYAATKIGGEMLADSYARLYNIPATGLRLFTVYGPWGRPDMAYFIFTEKILRGEPVDVYAAGEMSRDFTYIDDIIAVLIPVVDTPPAGDYLHEIYNIGHSQPVRLMDFISVIENACKRKAVINAKPKQKGDVSRTYADIRRARAAFGYDPKTAVETGIPVFVDWYRQFYGF